jgi:hypothetical protein
MTSSLGQDVLHWRDGSWRLIEKWDDWVRFTGWQKPWAALPYVGPGEHYFVVCVQEDGRLFNILRAPGQRRRGALHPNLEGEPIVGANLRYDR